MRPPHPRTHRALLAVLLSTLLSACGGGSGELLPEAEEAQRINPPNCTTHPERCQ